MRSPIFIPTLSNAIGNLSQTTSNGARTIITGRPALNTTLYEQVSTILKEKGVAITKSDAGQKEIHTDWITWLRADIVLPLKFPKFYSIPAVNSAFSTIC